MDTVSIPWPGNMEEVHTLTGLYAANFGDATIFATFAERKFAYWEPFTDPAETGTVRYRPKIGQLEEGVWRFSLFEADGDRYPEPVGITGDIRSRVVAIEPNGLITRDFPIPFAGKLQWTGGSPVAAKLHGHLDTHLLIPASLSDTSAYGVACLNLESGRSEQGFPLDFGFNQPGLKVSLGQLDEDPDIELVMTGDASGGFRVVNIPSPTGSDPVILWGTEGGNPGRTFSDFASYEPDPAYSGLNFDKAFCWPNPVTEDLAHFRFDPGTSGSTGDGYARVTVYDLVGREVAKTEKQLSDSGENEITLDCANFASGVYLARLAVGDDHVLIRFAVVQ